MEYIDKQYNTFFVYVPPAIEDINIPGYPQLPNSTCDFHCSKQYLTNGKRFLSLFYEQFPQAH